MVRNARNQSDPLSRVIQKLSRGAYVVPDFQRAFVWDADAVNELMRSLFQEYYIGSLLLWEGNENTFAEIDCKPLFGNDEPATFRRQSVVLDGQQRLSAMYYAFFAPDSPLPNRVRPDHFFIRIDELMRTDPNLPAASPAFFRRDVRDDSQRDRADEYETHEFPLRLMSTPDRLNRWILEYQDHWETRRKTLLAQKATYEGNASLHAHGEDVDAWEVAERASEEAAERAKDAGLHADNGARFGRLVDDLRSQYSISYIELEEELDRESVIDIFTQINRQGRQLTPFDLLNAQLALTGIRLNELAGQAHKELERDGFRLERNDADLIRIMLIGVHAEHRYDPTTWSSVVPGQGSRVHEGLAPTIVSAEDFLTEWRAAVQSLRVGLTALKAESHYGSTSGVRVSDFVPFLGMIPVYCALRAAAGGSRRKQGLVRQWYWASVLTERYYRTDSESLGSRDYREVLLWFQSASIVPAVISEFMRDFGPGKIGRAGVAKQQVPLYRGIMSLLFAMNPRNWITGELADAEQVVEIPIVSRAWCEQNDIPQEAFDSVFNLALVDRRVQSVISGKMPVEYLPSLLTPHGEDRLEQILRSHCISREGYEILQRDRFSPEDFADFLKERESCFLREVGELIFDAANLNIAARPRDLRVRREVLEKKLRSTIAGVLVETGSSLPDSVRPKLEKRAIAESRRHPSKDLVSQLTLRQLLNFADLRDLQDVVTNKRLWSLFESTFKNKESLILRFDGLVDVRTLDAHVRDSPAAAALDGEAAIAWFEKILDW